MSWFAFHFVLVQLILICVYTTDMHIDCQKTALNGLFYTKHFALKKKKKKKGGGDV
jgi:hypothetical protein